jgi:hypothetical protein
LNEIKSNNCVVSVLLASWSLLGLGCFKWESSTDESNCKQFGDLTQPLSTDIKDKKKLFFYFGGFQSNNDSKKLKLKLLTQEITIE